MILSDDKLSVTSHKGFRMVSPFQTCYRSSFQALQSSITPSAASSPSPFRLFLRPG